MAIKRTPEDFQVDEVLAEDLVARISDAPGPFALYRLTKEGLATPEAAARVARALGLPGGAVAYAGLKDKHALAAQHLTLKLDRSCAEAPERAEGPGWHLERIGWLPAPITATAIARNRFCIVLRALTLDACSDMERAAKLLDPGTVQGASGGQARREERLPAAIRIVNYFGDQRFGSARHRQGFLAKHLIRGEFEAALRLAIATEARKDRREQKDFKRTLAAEWGRWKELNARFAGRKFPERRALERLAHSSGDFRAAFCALPYFFQQLSVYAYQSHLWNSIARRMVAGQCAARGPVLAADDPFGEMLFPAATAIPEELGMLQLPLLGRKTELREPWKDAAQAVLDEEGITLDDLRIPGVRRPFFGEAPRGFLVQATQLELGPPEPDEFGGPGRFKRKVAFELPRGAYGTVVLRALGQ